MVTMGAGLGGRSFLTETARLTFFVTSGKQFSAAQMPTELVETPMKTPNRTPRRNLRLLQYRMWSSLQDTTAGDATLYQNCLHLARDTEHSSRSWHRLSQDELHLSNDATVSRQSNLCLTPLTIDGLCITDELDRREQDE